MPFDDEEVQGNKSLAQNATQAVADTDDLAVDFGDTDAMSTTDGLDKIEPADKKAYARCAVLTDIVPVQMAWGHYIQVGEKKAHVRCHSKRDKKHVIIGTPAICCQKLNNDDNQKAQVNFAALAVKYLNADPVDGKYKKDSAGEYAPIRWEIGWVKLSRPGFKTISELVMEGEQAFQFDFTISFRSTGIGYDYKRISQVARYRQIPELMAEVQAAALPFKDGVLLKKRLGKVVTDLDLRAMLAGKAANGAGKGVDNTDDL